MIARLLAPASALFCLFISFIVGLQVQDAADPMMMLPFMLMTAWLVVSGRLQLINPRDPVLLGFLGLWLIWGISAAHSDFPFNSRTTWIIMSTLPISYLVWRAADLNEKWQNGAYLAVLATGAVLAVWAILQATIYPNPLWPKRASLPFSDPNLLGLCLGMIMLPLLPFLLQKALDLRSRLIIVLLLVPLAAGMTVTQSRSALLGVIAGTGLILLMMRKEIVWSKPVILGVSAIAASMAGAFLYKNFFKRFAVLLSEAGDKSLQGRFSLWESAFDMSMNKPLLGYGFGTFNLYYPFFRKPAEDISAGWWVHMDPLQWAVESGWFAPAVFYALVTYIIVQVVKRKKSGLLSPLQAGFCGALACLFLNAHTAYPLHVIPFMLLATGMIASLVPAPLNDNPSKPSLIFSSALLITLLVLSWGAFKSAGTLLLWRDILVARGSADTPRFKTALQDCIERGDPQYAFCYLTLAEAAITMSAEPPNADVLAILESARKYNPELAQPDYYRGLYYARLDQGKPSPRAIEAFKDSLRHNPTFWPARKSLVTAQIQSGAIMDALKTLERGSSYPIPNTEISYYHDTYEKLTQAVYPGQKKNP